MTSSTDSTFLPGFRGSGGVSTEMLAKHLPEGSRVTVTVLTFPSNPRWRTLEGLSAITLLELRISGFPALAEEVPECGIEVPVGGLQGLRVHISQEREDFFKLHEKLVALIIVRSLLPSPVCFRPEIQKTVIDKTYATEGPRHQVLLFFCWI